MVAFLDSFPFSRQLVLYVLAISLARGIFLPDFRYDMVSIVLIQVIYPIALFAPLVMKLQGEHYWSYYFLCIGGIVVAELVALLRYYFDAGIENLMDGVSIPISMLSFFAQIGLYSVLVVLLFLVTKAKSFD